MANLPLNKKIRVHNKLVLLVEVTEEDVHYI